MPSAYAVLEQLVLAAGAMPRPLVLLFVLLDEIRLLFGALEETLRQRVQPALPHETAGKTGGVGAPRREIPGAVDPAEFLLAVAAPTGSPRPGKTRRVTRRLNERLAGGSGSSCRG